MRRRLFACLMTFVLAAFMALPTAAPPVYALPVIIHPPHLFSGAPSVLKATVVFASKVDLTWTALRFTDGDADVYVKDQVQSMDIAPIITNGRTMRFFRYGVTPLEADVTWGPVGQMVTMKTGSKRAISGLARTPPG